jgi:hypothetical protein
MGQQKNGVLANVAGIFFPGVLTIVTEQPVAAAGADIGQIPPICSKAWPLDNDAIALPI